MKGFVIAVLVIVLGGVGWYMYKGKDAGKDAMTSEPAASSEAHSDAADTTASSSAATAGNASSSAAMQNASSTAAEGRVIVVTGKNFDFSTEEIKVKKGETITIEFESTDGFHDWVVDEFAGARTKQVNPGTKTSATFVADKAGTFEYYCSVGKHRELGMVGKLIVE